MGEGGRAAVSEGRERDVRPKDRETQEERESLCGQCGVGLDFAFGFRLGAIAAGLGRGGAGLGLVPLALLG